MSRKEPTVRRLTGTVRREAILQASAFVFAERGFAGTTTQAIASRANISEALLYRHFASKQALYRAVLRDLLRKQDLQVREQATATDDYDLVFQIRVYLAGNLAMRDGDEMATTHRVMITSLVGDGRYARIIYRRALRMRRGVFVAALARLQAERGIPEDRLDPANAFMFVEHVGSMLALGRLPARQIMPYAGDDAALLEQALLFCIRGLGLPGDLIGFPGEG
jgi:AcrR family transcriptional regulator